MKSAPVVQLGKHRWWIIFDQEERRVIDSNVYLMEADGEALILDPGGFEIFPQVFAGVAETIRPDAIRAAFVSHQDPDIASSLPLWSACNDQIRWHVPKLWDGFIRHYGALDATFVDIPDEGMEIRIGGKTLQILPAHYLHSSANFHVYDPVAKVLFSGDVGAALLPQGHSAFLDRRRPEAFDEHIAHAKYFHERWMPSNDAKREWCARVGQLDIEYLCPQHGAIYEGEHVQRFLQWFDALPVGRVGAV